MPRFTASKDKIEGKPPIPEGIYSFRLDGWKPKWSKDKGSINLNPVLKVINHAEYNDRYLYENLNTKGEWVWKDFCHALGVPLPQDASGEYEFPGKFVDPNDPNGMGDPEKYEYTGPLTGQIGQCKVVQTSYNNKPQTKIQFYICKVPGCTEQHSKDLT